MDWIGGIKGREIFFMQMLSIIVYFLGFRGYLLGVEEGRNNRLVEIKISDYVFLGFIVVTQEN